MVQEMLEIFQKGVHFNVKVIMNNFNILGLQQTIVS